MTTTRMREPGTRTAIAVIVVLHVLGWGGLLLLTVRGVHFGPAGSAATVAIGWTAYTLGLRHAFDADHIAAIDNTTRRLVDRKRPAGTVGLWFSLGHSSVVLLLCIGLALGIGALGGALGDEGSGLQRVAGIWGPTVSGLFLLVIAAVNVRALRADRHPEHGAPSGVLWRLLGRFDSAVDRPTRMYLVGLLFGLGFDTATEIGLLALAGSASIAQVPWWAVLTLPLLFAAGMSALDTAQGAAMRRAYSAAPERRAVLLRYRTATMAVSVATALVVAAVQLSSVAVESFGWTGPVAWIAERDIEDLGIWLTACLLLLWGSLLLALRRSDRSDGAPGAPARPVM